MVGMVRWRGWPLLLSTAVGCATGAPVGGLHAPDGARYRPVAAAALPAATPAPRPEVDGTEVLEAPADGRSRAVELARSLVGKPRVQMGGKRYPDDCTGLIKGVFDRLGINLTGEARSGDNGVTAIYRFAQAHGRIYEGGRPVAGDLVFFRETYDLNRDGRANDGLTHIGLVESVDADGTVRVIHRVRRGVVRYRMNLQHPSTHLDPATGVAINDYLRLPGPGHAEVLTGQLFAAYATLLPLERRHAQR